MAADTLVSLHEAAHAVVAAAVGYAVGCVWIDGGGNGQCEWHRPRLAIGDRAACEKEVVVLWAGASAERHYLRNPAFRRDLAWRDDMGLLAALDPGLGTGAAYRDFLRAATGRSEQLVAANWSAIERLAERLRRHRSLTAAEARRALDLYPVVRGRPTGGRFPAINA